MSPIYDLDNSITDALCKSFLLTAFQTRRKNLTHTLNQPAARQGFGRTCNIDFDHLVQYLAAPL